MVISWYKRLSAERRKGADLNAAEVLQSSFDVSIPQAELAWHEDPREQLCFSASWFNPWLATSNPCWGRGGLQRKGKETLATSGTFMTNSFYRR